MRKWILPLCTIAIFAFITALFLTPSFTYRCTQELLECVEQATKDDFWMKLWSHLKCVYHNVICVLGGLFV